MQDTKVRELYIRWLQGESLRQLGRSEGCSYFKIWYQFHRVLGKDSTDTRKMSLARSLMKDYQGNSEALSWVTKETPKDCRKHRSLEAISNVAHYQYRPYDDGYGEIAVDYSEQEPEPLRNCLLQTWLTYVVDLLENMGLDLLEELDRECA